MAALKITLLVALAACIFLTEAQISTTTTEATPTPTSGTTPTTEPSSDRSISIESSNAPTTQFEWDAVQCLTEAYLLYPNNFDTTIHTFGELFRLKHSGNWRVGAACSSLYIASNNITITMRVTEGSKHTLIDLYN